MQMRPSLQQSDGRVALMHDMVCSEALITVETHRKALETRAQCFGLPVALELDKACWAALWQD
jgi:hypothetical protein